MSELLKLKNQAQPFKIQIKNKAETKAEILIYGSIGFSWYEDSISANSFVEALKALPDTINEIDVRINSPGGDVFEGWVIYNRLKQHKAKITTHIDGMAASIASIIMLAGDTIIMGEGAQIMIHNAWTFAGGNSRELDAVSNRLQEIDQQLISAYAKKTKLSRDEISGYMEKETWFNADLAMELGFADSKSEETLAIAASAIQKASWIHKAPMAKIKTEEQEVIAKVNDFKNKVDTYLARQKA